jgi:hypothetical protein
MRAARTTISKLRTPGAAIHLESPVSDMDPYLWHPHLHVLAHVPAGGRNFIRPGDWIEEFYEQLPNTWHPAANHAHVSGVIESRRRSRHRRQHQRACRTASIPHIRLTESLNLNHDCNPCSHHRAVTGA